MNDNFNENENQPLDENSNNKFLDTPPEKTEENTDELSLQEKDSNKNDSTIDDIMNQIKENVQLNDDTNNMSKENLEQISNLINKILDERDLNNQPSNQMPQNGQFNPYAPPMNPYGYQPPINPFATQYYPPINQPRPMPINNMNFEPPTPPITMTPADIDDNLNNQNNQEINEDDVAVKENKRFLKFTISLVSIIIVISMIVSYFPFNEDIVNFNSNGESPTMDISYTPDAIPNNDETGILTNNEIHDKVSPSVVGIAVYTRGLGQVLQSEGSGIIMSNDGFIVTNYHVIANNSTNPVVKIEIIMPNGDTHEARVIGGDSKTDLAVVKIDVLDLIPAEFGDSSKLKIGDRVAVIGNPSGIAFAGSFTQGCVSALSRNIYMSDLNAEIEYIQTDAAINSGNSGGAFINEYGQVVGISAAKMKVEAGYEGMGFAIPINNAKIIIDSLIENGYVAGRPKVGIEYKAISPTLAELNSIPIGLRVYTVYENVDAHEKIFPGDIITQFDGVEVFDSESVATALSDKIAGEELVITVYRVDETTGISEYIDVTIILSESVGEKLAETMN